MDDKSIQTETDNANDRQPLPDPKQIEKGRSIEDMMDYYAAIGYAICRPDITTEQEAAFLDEVTRRQILGERLQQIGQAGLTEEKLEKIQDNVKTVRKDIGLRISFDEMVELYRSGHWMESRRQLYRMMTLAPIANEISKLSPYFEKEISKPEYQGKTIDDLLEEAELNEDGDPLQESLLYKALNAAYKERGQGSRPELRTAAKAGDIQRILRDKLAIPTDTEFLYAITLLEQGNAHMLQMKMDGLTFSDGKLYFKDDRIREVSEVELQDLKTKENIDNINLPFLQFYYSQLFAKWEDVILEQATGKDGAFPTVTRFYLPDLAKARGLSNNVSRESVDAIKNDIAAFHNVIGVLKVKGYNKPSYYPVLNFEGYDTVTNTISISSPYLLHVVEQIYAKSVRRTKDGRPKLKSNGTPQTKAVNSYLVHSDIQKERNKAAVQSVFIIVQGIETKGGGEGTVYRLKAETLISRNPLLEQQIAGSSNRRLIIQRHFKKTWELLRDKTDLKEAYKNIVLPDPGNPADLPTEKGLSTFVIKITHDGKNVKVR